MSELINTSDNRATIRWKLLTGASALALAAYVSSSSLAKAEDATRPLIWLELDGQFSLQNANIELYSPPFMSASPFDGISHLGLEKSAPKIWDKSAKLTFQPEGSDWVLTLAARYGKVGRSETREGHPTTANMTKYSGNKYSAYQHFQTHASESHAILDFQAGKEVGLGLLGNSTLSAGLRIAQFNSRSSVEIKSQPTNLPTGYAVVHKFYATFAAKRRFSGLGPSISWNGAATIAGNPTDGSITLDWGVNGALLFGRQRAMTQHQTAEYRYSNFKKAATLYHFPASAARSKNVTVPNFGGFAGVSWRTSNAKISIGYRADMFFSAIDGGIDTRKSEDRAFYGPFASISVGLGD